MCIPPQSLLRTGALALGLVAGIAGAGEQDTNMYRCDDGQGGVTYSQEPCGANAQAVDVQYDAPSPAEAATAEGQLEAEIDETDAVATEQSLADQIAASEQRIADLAAERDQRLAALAAARNAGTETIGDAQYGTAILGDMGATADRYNARIAAETARLQELRMRR